MSLLKHLTLVIPSYNRTEYLIRAMKFWSGKAVTLLALDGSSKSVSEELLKGIAPNVHYIHNPVSIQERLAQSCTLIQTKYAALLSDDDFFASTGLEEAIAELEANPDLVSCNGNCISFKWRATENFVSTRLNYPEQIGLNIRHQSTEERITEHFRNYTPASIYAVNRAETFILGMQAASHKNSCVYSLEMAFEFVASFMGGMKTLNCCYWLRSLDNEPVSVTGADRGFRFHQWLTMPEFKDEVDAWFAYISELLSVVTKKPSNVLNLLKLSCQQYIVFADEHFAATNRAYRGQPGRWHETCVFLESKGVRPLPEVEKILELVEQFHLSKDLSLKRE
ncbi:TIGR00180 family glycosyltransferase [Rheinheimera faecalis]